MKTLELLAPAKNLECGKAAISHGADAVYIGAKRFGARTAASNSTEDIAELCHYAHQYRAKVYVTVNTIVYDDELTDTLKLINELYDAGADALLVQDMGVVDRNKENTNTLHASTQTDNRTAERVAWLRSLGFRRVVLARELSAHEISEIHHAVPDVELEVFVHGALCVSYSGICYASEYCFGRSANRGACAQFCRLKFDLIDNKGHVIEHDRHLLSLKDMCQADRLEELAEAGATSFKIEGRLKDAGYVKNVVAAYSQQLDALIRKYPDRYCRASVGRCTYTFTPDLRKTFNRGYTHYFLDGRQGDITSFDTPKARGEYVGRVKEIRGRSFNVAGTATFANGDGLCFLNDNRELEGFRVNRVEGNRLFPQHMPTALRPGTPLFRNNDAAFEKLLAGQTAERRIPISMTLATTREGFSLTATAEGFPPTEEYTPMTVTAKLATDHQKAERPQRDNIVRQLTRLGNTVFEYHDITITDEAGQYFIPSSQLATLRRLVVDALTEKISTIRDISTDNNTSKGMNPSEDNTPSENIAPISVALPKMPYYDEYPYLYNIANHAARHFYEQQGLESPGDAFEHSHGKNADKEPLLMQCRHCLRYSLGYCIKHGGKKPSWYEPLYLVLPDRRRFRLEFDCHHCQMNVYASVGNKE